MHQRLTNRRNQTQRLRTRSHSAQRCCISQRTLFFIYCASACLRTTLYVLCSSNGMFVSFFLWRCSANRTAGAEVATEEEEEEEERRKGFSALDMRCRRVSVRSAPAVLGQLELSWRLIWWWLADCKAVFGSGRHLFVVHVILPDIAPLRGHYAKKKCGLSLKASLLSVGAYRFIWHHRLFCILRWTTEHSPSCLCTVLRFYVVCAPSLFAYPVQLFSLWRACFVCCLCVVLCNTLQAWLLRAHSTADELLPSQLPTPFCPVLTSVFPSEKLFHSQNEAVDYCFVTTESNCFNALLKLFLFILCKVVSSGTHSLCLGETLQSSPAKLR